MATLTAAQAAAQITPTPNYAAGQGYASGAAPFSVNGQAVSPPGAATSPAPSIGNGTSTNSYAVVNSQPATQNLASIGTAFNGIKQGMANQTTANAQNAVLPTIPGYTVSQTPTGAQGETQATNNATGNSYYITPQVKPASAGDVISALNGPGFGTDASASNSQSPQTNDQILSQNQGASPTPSPTTLTPTSPNGGNVDTSNLPPETAQIVKDMAQNNQDAAQAYATFSQTIQQVTNGTFPLTTAQQALVDSTNTAFQNMSNYLKLKGVALSSQTGGISNKIAASAGDLFSATQQQTAAVAKLEMAFQQQDYTQITDAYNEYTKAEDDKTSTLKNMFDTATTATQNAINDAREQQQVDETAKQNAITDQIAIMGTYSHYTDANGQDVLYNVKTGKIINPQGNPDITVTADSTPGSTGNPILDNNTDFSGKVPWINGANIKGAKAQSAAQLNAALMHVPFISNTAQVGALDKITTANANLDAINSQIDGFLPVDGTGRILGGAEGNILSSYFQQNDPQGNKMAAFASWRSAAVGILQALAGGAGSGLRINQAEINMSLANDIPNITDTIGVAQQKMQNIQSQLQDAQKGIFGEKVYNKYNPTPASVSASNALNSTFGLSSSNTPKSQADSTVSSAFSGIGI